MRCSYILVCFGCQIVPAWYLDYVFAPSHRRTNNPLPFICLPTSSVCLLYLSASELPPLVQKQLSWPSFSSSGNCIPLTPHPPHPQSGLRVTNARLCPAEMSNQFSLSPIFSPTIPVCFCFLSSPLAPSLYPCFCFSLLLFRGGSVCV